MRIEDLLEAGDGLIVRGHHRGAASSIDRALRDGLVERLLPGVYCRAGCATVMLRARAVMEAASSAVVVGRAAAALTWWPELPVPTVNVALPTKRVAGSGIAWSQRRVSSARVALHAGVRVTEPSLTVLDLVAELGGTAIDEALRRRCTTLAGLWDALAESPDRPGNELRRALLHDSRDEPWSEAERHFHRIIRSLRLPHRYVTNHPVTVRDGSVRILDVALPSLRLGFEVDGYAFHGAREAFVGDRLADVQLARAGWQRLRFAAQTVFDDPTFVRGAVRDIVRRRVTWG